MPFCPKCGKYTHEKPGAIFCPYCGSHLNTKEFLKTSENSRITEESGIVLDSDEQVLLDIDIHDSSISVPIDKEKILADVIWLRPFGLFNYLFANAERSSGTYHEYIFSGKLTITNKRLIVFNRVGFLTSELVPILILKNLKSIHAIKVSKRFFRGSKLLITYESQNKTLHTMDFNTNESYEFLSGVVHKIRWMIIDLKWGNSYLLLYNTVLCKRELWPRYLPRHEIEIEIRKLMHMQEEIDYRIFKLEQLRSRILANPMPSHYERERIARIDAEISRLNLERKKIERRITYLRDLLYRSW